MSETEVTEAVLFKALLWVPAADRELMISEMAKEYGPEAGGLLEHFYAIHRVNESE